MSRAHAAVSIASKVGLFSTRSIDDVEVGRRLLTILTTSGGALVPERFGDLVGYRYRFDPSNLDAVLDHWRYPFLWRRRRPEVEGRFLFGNQFHLSGVSLESSDPQALHEAMIGALKSFAMALEPSFGFYHLLTEAERERARKRKTTRRLVVSTGNLRRCLPDLYWLTVFGPEYLKLFDEQRVRETPVHHVHQWSADSLALQLTPSIQDVASDPSALDRVRRRAMEHLGVDAFYDEALGMRHRYRAPDLGLAPKPVSALDDWLWDLE